MRRLLALQTILACVVGAAAAACGSGGTAIPAGVSRQEYVEACARLGACVPAAALAQTLTQCAALPAAAREALSASLTAAIRCAKDEQGDCAAILSCYSAGEPTTACDVAAVPSCLDGSRSSQCLLGTPLVQDCTLAGTVCVSASGDGAVPGCGVEACGVGYVSTCQGDLVVRCEGGVAVVADCPTGARCRADAGGAQCVGRGAPCPPGTAADCQGHELVDCVGGAEARRDCRAGDYQATCAIVEGGPACFGTLVECNPALFVDRCNGARLEYCSDGRVEGVDCVALGFAECSRGDPTRTVPSRCAPLGGGNLDAGPPDAAPLPDAPTSDAGGAP